MCLSGSAILCKLLLLAVVIGMFFDKECGEWCWEMQFLVLLRASPLSVTLSAISVSPSVVYPPGGGRPVQVEDI
jgi:hypothetical protein